MIREELESRFAAESGEIGADEPILVTGAGGFIGGYVVACLASKGFRRIRCLTRTGSPDRFLPGSGGRLPSGVEVMEGDLLCKEDCAAAVKGAPVIYHLAAGRGEKSMAGAFLNSVVTTRNLLEAALAEGCLRRFVNVSSVSVFSNRGKPSRRVLDENCPIEDQPPLKGEAYTYGKVKQDEIVMEYREKHRLPCVFVRPGVVYGPGRTAVTGRVGLATFGPFLHLGGANPVPFTYVENCAEAIVLAGLIPGIDGESFNIVDDHLPTSRSFLREYKRTVGRFRSIYVPHWLSYALCLLWERYSRASARQLPPAFNSRKWHAYWKRTYYSNEKAKTRLGWEGKVTTQEGLKRYFEYCKGGSDYA